MSDIHTLQNFDVRDPFAEAQEIGHAPSGSGPRTKAQDVHIRVQQRNGRKCITTVQGLHPRLDFKGLTKEFKQRWGCNGTVINTPEAGQVIQLQGDQRDHVKEFLLTEKLAREENIRTHGF